MATIEERVCGVIVGMLEVDPGRVIPNASLVGDLEADLLDLPKLVIVIEEEFGIELSDSEAESISTVQNVLDLLRKKGIEG